MAVLIDPNILNDPIDIKTKIKMILND